MSALRLLESSDLNHPLAGKPLAITVTDDGKRAVHLHALLRQVLPVLRQPESFPASYRTELAVRAEHLLSADSEDALPPPDLEEYEPGCWLDDEPALDENAETEEPW
jgi:hypothetical protein